MAARDETKAGPRAATAEAEPGTEACRPWISDFDRLTRSGAVIPSPETMDEAALSTKLWELVGRLAGKSIYLLHTDHLSDRELYERLWSDVLREETPDSYDSDDEGCWIVDLVGSGSDEDLTAWLTYYANDQERVDFGAVLSEDFCLPEREELLYDRDRHLPSPIRGLLGSSAPQAAPDLVPVPPLLAS